MNGQYLLLESKLLYKLLKYVYTAIHNTHEINETDLTEFTVLRPLHTRTDHLPPLMVETPVLALFYEYMNRSVSIMNLMT